MAGAAPEQSPQLLPLCNYPSTRGRDVNKLSEDRVVTISRVNGTLAFPANFMLIAASDPTPIELPEEPVLGLDSDNAGLSPRSDCLSEL